MQRLEARPRLVATATATFHFISFLRLVPFRFSGFAEWLRGAVAEIRNRIKMRQRLERQLCGNEIQMYLGLPLTDCLSLSGFAWGRSFACCMSHVSSGEGCIHFIHIFPCCMCVKPNSTQSHVFFVCVSVCICIS